jgi:hypothetical protein
MTRAIEKFGPIQDSGQQPEVSDESVVTVYGEIIVLLVPTLVDTIIANIGDVQWHAGKGEVVDASDYTV